MISAAPTNALADVDRAACRRGDGNVRGVRRRSRIHDCSVRIIIDIVDDAATCKERAAKDGNQREHHSKIFLH